MESWTMTLRVEVHLCPAVAREPNATPFSATSMSHLSVTMAALLPPSSRIDFPKRSATLFDMTLPVEVDPVNDTRGILLSCDMRLPISFPDPQTSENMGGAPLVSRVSARSFITPIATRAAFVDGFQSTASPQAAAIIEFQDHTADGKLKAVITPTIPTGDHCSRSLWFGLSLAIVSP